MDMGKGIAALILAKRRPKPEADEDDNDTVEYSMKYRDASEEILSAVEKKDPELLTHTLKDFIKMCLADHEEDEGEADDEEY